MPVSFQTPPALISTSPVNVLVPVPASVNVPVTEVTPVTPKVKVELVAKVPPDSIVKPLAVALAATVTVWPFRMVTKPSALVGTVVPVTQLVPPSVDSCQLAAVPQLKEVALLLNCFAGAKDKPV